MKKVLLMSICFTLLGCAATGNVNQVGANNCRVVIQSLLKADKDQAIPSVDLLPALNQCVAFSETRGAQLSANSYELKGAYHSMRKEPLLAVAAYEKMFEVAPYKTKEMWRNVSLAISYRDSKQYDKSIATLERALKNNPPTMPIFYNMAQTYYQAGNYNKVVETIGLGLPFQKDYSWAYWYRGLAYEKLGKKDLAKEDFVVMNAMRIADYKKNPSSFTVKTDEAKQMVEEVNAKFKSYQIEQGILN